MVVDDIQSVPETVGIVFVCVNVTNGQQQRETDIILTYSVTEGNSFISMSLIKFLYSQCYCCWPFLNSWIPSGESQDFLTINDTIFVITPEDSQVCVQFRVIDDDTVEDPEDFTVTIDMSGQIIGNTTVVIIDNDGECVCVCVCVCTHV